MEIKKSLRVLASIAHRLNTSKIVWAVGGSMLLYFKNIATEFHDIDIMVKNEDVEALKTILQQMGTLEPPKSSAQYKTKTFLEFVINGVEIDVMAGFFIVNDGMAYDCSLKGNEIAEYITVENERIPLHSVELWRRYYELMGKTSKVQLIDAMNCES